MTQQSAAGGGWDATVHLKGAQAMHSLILLCSMLIISEYTPEYLYPETRFSDLSCFLVTKYAISTLHTAQGLDVLNAHGWQRAGQL